MFGLELAFQARVTVAPEAGLRVKLKSEIAATKEFRADNKTTFLYISIHPCPNRCSCWHGAFSTSPAIEHHAGIFSSKLRAISSGDPFSKALKRDELNAARVGIEFVHN